MNRAFHEIEPIYNKESRILILGSFPSVKSREAQFFYHHPQNRFWKVLAQLYDHAPLLSISEKKTFLLEHRIAVWDVIASCEIIGSSDSSIKNIVPNDMNAILSTAKIHHIYTNGGTAFKLYEKYCRLQTNFPSVKLPSTSPANAAFSLQRLLDEWKIIQQ